MSIFIQYIIVNLILLSIFLGAMIGVISTYVVYKKISMIGDIISHSTFPGIILSFLITNSTNNIYLIIGGFFSAYISILLSDFIKKKINLPKDTVYGLVLSSFFSFGIILMSIVQRKEIGGQVAINSSIFGNLITFSSESIIIYILFSILILVFMIISFNMHKNMNFDSDFCKIRYKNNNIFEKLLLISTVTGILIGLKIIGILLIGSMIISPGAFSKGISNSYFNSMFFAILISVFSFLIGIFITINFNNIPTGPIVSIIPICSCILICIVKIIKNRFII